MAMNDYKERKAIILMSSDTKAGWTSKNLVLPPGYIAVETDARTGADGKPLPLAFKIGDGTTAYTDLKYAGADSLTPAQKEILEKAGQAGGACILDSNGKIPVSALPSAVTTHITYVADIAARDAVDVADRKSLFFVVDATADTTVAVGWGLYWYDATASSWVKLSEGESLDFDFSNVFDTSKDTLDKIADGTNFVKMTTSERQKLTDLAAQDETVVIRGLNAAETATALA